MNDVFLRYVFELPVSVLGFTIPDGDGNYNVYINGKAALNKQVEALNHELRHIRRGDFCKEEAAHLIEKAMKECE